MKNVIAALVEVAAGAVLLSGCWGGSGSDDANTATPAVETSTPSITAEPTATATSTVEPTATAAPEPQAELQPGVSDAIAGWVATEQNSEYIGPCPPGDAPADTIGEWCHLPPQEAEANRIVIWVGAVASGNVWELVLEKDAEDAWEVVSAEKVRGT